MKRLTIRWSPISRVDSIDPLGMKNVLSTKVFEKPRKRAATRSASRYSRKTERRRDELIDRAIYRKAPLTATTSADLVSVQIL